MKFSLNAGIFHSIWMKDVEFLMMTFKKGQRTRAREKKDKIICAYDKKVPILKIILENLIISSAKKIGRPTLVNLPTYYVRFSSDHAQPTYLPKIGRH